MTPSRAVPLAAAAYALFFGAVSISAEAPAARSLITNVRVVDGTGAPARRAAVRIQGDRIVEIGDLSRQKGEQVIDGAGHVLAPGFIDTHSHHDDGLFEQPDALAAVSQGITTVIVGQDGWNAQPLPELFRLMQRVPVAINVGAYVGHNAIRRAVMGEDFRRQATPVEIDRMRELVREGMRAGALGLSTGLEYDPGIYSSKDEVIALAREAAAAHGRYSSHMRSEDRRVWEALDELIEIGRATGMPVHVSHMKLAMTDWWGQAGRFTARMDEARARGIDVTGDVYPYEYWQSGLQVLFPDRDFDNRASAEFALRSLAPPDGLLMSSFTPDPSLVGKTVAQIARLRGTDPATTLMDLIRESEESKGIAGVIGTSMNAADIASLIAWPHANICTDGSLDDSHPRGAGSMTRVLRQYVREQHLLTLEQAVAKLSATAAASAGIRDRGQIRPGMRADLVLFDPATVADRATLAQPTALSVGIDKVWVNGQVVFENGKATTARPGMPVLREPRAAVTLPRTGDLADRELHERLIVLDTHLDTPGQLDRPGWSIMDRHGLQDDLSQVDYPRLVEGGVDGGFWAIFTYQRELTPQGYDTALSQALKRAEQIRRMVADNPSYFTLATEAEDANRIVSKGKRVVYISIENAYPLGTDLDLLEKFYSLGVRMIGPVHTSDNQFADSATDERRTWRGLSPAGITLVEKANQLGMIVDASHASDEAFDQMLARSRAPIILSHSGCDAVYDHPRNIDDKRLRALAAAGGVIQMNTLGEYLKKLPETPERDREMDALRARFPPFATLTPDQVAQYMVARQEIGRRHPPARATFEDFMRHMLHAIAVAGVDHVGIGADWDGGGGVDGLEDVSKVPGITARLRKEGFSDQQVAKIMGGNTLRVLCEARRVASSNAISERWSAPGCSPLSK